MNPPILQLFVYGSLKRGFNNYHRYCRGVRSVEAAEITGCLYRAPTGYPVLVLSADSILAQATANPLEDVETQQRFSKELVPMGSGYEDNRVGKRRVCGELLSFANPADRLRAIDGLEGFTPHRPSTYERVLTSVFSRTRQAHLAAWTYTAGPLSAQRRLIVTGRWDG